ncbi:galactose mutarotase-like protein [Aulographum hederae CBS 113979]|uniref:Glucose-6-phosphate 1-epimerase n=1 Tax=Aulographum hederae CBS 113979 TaxID=1176131 RepID=A0A6G1GVI5_9PEZI|nr:galactose mutarotase-like protein [Aulographum hederae CBS 113979]
MVDRPNKPSAISPTTMSPQPTVTIADDNSTVTAKLPSGEEVTVLLHGATVLSWKAAGGQELLWLSEGAVLDGSKPVRGGIPLVFPVFGPPPKNHATSSLPQHGFARSSRWEYLGKSSTEAQSTTSDNSIKLDFGLYSTALSAEARKAWPYDFGLVYSVTLSKEGLQTMVTVQNEGKEAFEFQVLLHTYFRVKDISKTTVTGLAGLPFIDKVANATQGNPAPTVTFSGEVDRVYTNIPQSTTSILDADGKPYIDVVRDNLSDTVVWNPWTEKAKGMGDFQPKDGFKHMVCVEAGAVEGWTKLEAGETWEGGMLAKSHL